MTPTGPAALALPATVVAAVLWLVVACAVGGTQPHTAPPATTLAGLGPTLQPVTPTTPPAIASTQAIQTSPPGSPNLAQPPAAGLSTDSVASSNGLLGTYCWHGACLDADPFTDREPDLPALTMGSATEQLHFALVGTQFVDWSASYVNDDGNVKQLGGSKTSFDPDAAGASAVPLSVATFPAPPAGSQSIVQVFVRFVDGGDASYGWNVTVP